MPKMKTVGKKIIASVSVPEKGESFLWKVTDNDVTFHHFVQCGYITHKEMSGVQLVLGPFLFAITWLKGLL